MRPISAASLQHDTHLRSQRLARIIEKVRMVLSTDPHARLRMDEEGYSFTVTWRCGGFIEYVLTMDAGRESNALRYAEKTFEGRTYQYLLDLKPTIGWSSGVADIDAALLAARLHNRAVELAAMISVEAQGPWVLCVR